MKQKIENLIKDALKNLGIEEVAFSIEHPEDFKNGDYSTNVAMVCAKNLKMNPKELAEKISAEIFSAGDSQISKIETAGPGFINFYLSREFFTDSVKEVITVGENWGKVNIGQNKTVVVEYSSPNIAKPFTIGHLRSTIIGDSIARIFDFTGHKVVRDNHLGDWGTQFGKLIVAIKKWGNFENIEKEENPIKALVELYVKFHEEGEKDPSLEDEARAWFTKIEKGDKEAKEIWQKCVDLSMKEFSKIYERLGILPFDTMHGESFFEDKMSPVLEDVKNKNLGKESEEAYLIFFPEEKKMNPLMLLKKDGSSLYALRDLAADRFRKAEYGNDVLIINEVGLEQREYFQQIFEAEEMLGYFPKKQRVHVGHGLYRFKEGKMSTRKGNVIWLEDILDEANKRAGEINKDSAEIVAIGAIKFNDLRREISKDIVFNWKEILNLKGDSGPYLQYSAIRAKSILSKTNNEFLFNEVPEQISDLEKLLYRFPEVVGYSQKELEPHHIATYLITLASSFSSFYANTQILNTEDKYSQYYVTLTKAFLSTMEKGLWLLGISLPEKM